MKSLWKNGIVPPSFPEVEGKVNTDVLIIGGGIAGLLTAYMLQREGIDYMLVEKDRICGGNTQNTTAKITCQHSLIYSKLLKAKGTETAQGYLLANKEAFNELCGLCKNADCDFEFKNNFVYSKDPNKLNDEMTALERLGYNAVFTEKLPLPVEAKGAVCFENQAQFHPLKFLYSIANGLNIFENSFVKEMKGTTAVTDKAEIKAENVIITTHFPFINKHGLYSLKLYQQRSYVIALEKAQDVNGMYVDESDTGLSFRNYKNLLLLGGGGHRTGKQGGNWSELRSFAKEKYPDSSEKFYWAAQDCMSLDNMPYIGSYSPNTPKLFTASGFCKWGMTGAMLSAMLLRDKIIGKQNDYADFFRPDRSILQPQLFINGFESVTNLLSFSKKRCPHLGCALKWNKAEHSWDCPCHGSRFDEHGKNLDNPANGNMNI
ncbi:MAG: FAD-dependent oxidoreductase [Clostridia bacterium]|nr:FAD-dependent oxidoreductase [Clostridia bacterium]